MKQIIIAIGIGIILSFFFIAMTVPQTVEQPVIEITPVPTPEPVYLEPETTPIAITTPGITTDVPLETKQEQLMELMGSMLGGSKVLVVTCILGAVFGLVHSLLGPRQYE